MKTRLAILLPLLATLAVPAHAGVSLVPDIPFDQKVSQSGLIVTGVVTRVTDRTLPWTMSSNGQEEPITVKAKYARVKIGLELKGAVQAKEIDVVVYHSLLMETYTPPKRGATYLLFLEPKPAADGSFWPTHGRYGIYQVYPKAEAPFPPDMLFKPPARRSN